MSNLIHNEESLFINEKLANRFLTLKEFNHYNDTDIENLLFNICMKIVDNDFKPNDRLVNDNILFIYFINFYDEINHKRKSYYDIQVRNITNSYNKKIKEGKEPYYSIDDTISRIKYKKSGSISYKICLFISKEIMKLNIQSSFCGLFVLICKYVFNVEFNLKVANSNIEYTFSSFSNTQFLIFKDNINLMRENYNKKMNKDKKENK